MRPCPVVAPRTLNAVDGRLTLHTAPSSWCEPPNRGPKDCSVSTRRNDEFRANDSDQHRKNVAPYWDVRFRFRVPGVERLPGTLSFLAKGPSDHTVGEDEEGAAEGANVPGGTPDALVFPNEPSGTAGEVWAGTSSR